MAFYAVASSNRRGGKKTCGKL